MDQLDEQISLVAFHPEFERFHAFPSGSAIGQEKQKHPHPKEFQIIPRILARNFFLEDYS